MVVHAPLCGRLGTAFAATRRPSETSRNASVGRTGPRSLATRWLWQRKEVFSTHANARHPNNVTRQLRTPAIEEEVEASDSCTCCYSALAIVGTLRGTVRQVCCLLLVATQGALGYEPPHRFKCHVSLLVPPDWTLAYARDYTSATCRDKF